MLIKDKRMVVFDIGARNTKIIMGKIKDKQIHIEKYEIIPTPLNAIRDGRIMDKKAITEHLSKMKLKGKDIRIVLSSDELVLRNFDFPKMDKQELLEAIKFEMGILLPEKVENYIIDYSIMEEFSKINDNKEVSMVKVQGVAILKNIVNNYIYCFSKVGHKLSIIDIQSNCINKLFCSTEDYIQSQGNMVIIDFGHEKTTMTFMEDKQVFLHRQLKGGSVDVTRIIANVLNIDMRKAEEWKHRNDFSFLKQEEHENSVLADEINKYFHDITMELYQVIEFFISMSKNKKLDDIYIIGGGALIPHIHEFIEQYVNIKVQRIDTLNKVSFSALQSQDDISIMASSLGAFIRRG